ncbi:hypothetical protein [Azospirillum sp. sgz301742]
MTTTRLLTLAEADRVLVEVQATSPTIRFEIKTDLQNRFRPDRYYVVGYRDIVTTTPREEAAA